MTTNRELLKAKSLENLRLAVPSGHVIAELQARAQIGRIEKKMVRELVCLPVILAREELFETKENNTRSFRRRKPIRKAEMARLVNEILAEILAHHHDDPEELSFTNFVMTAKDDKDAREIAIRSKERIPNCLSADEIYMFMKTHGGQAFDVDELWRRYIVWRKDKIELAEFIKSLG